MATNKKTQDLEQKLARAERQLIALQKVSRLLAQKLTLPEALQAILDVVSDATGGDSCLIYLIDNDELVLCGSSPAHPEQIGRIRLKMGEGLTGWVAKERRMVSIPQEAYRDLRFHAFTDLPEDTFEAFLSVPVIVRGEVVGVINVQHRQPHPHSGSEMEMIRTVGEQVGCVIVLARMGLETEYSKSHVEFLLSMPQPAPPQG